MSTHRRDILRSLGTLAPAVLLPSCVSVEQSPPERPRVQAPRAQPPQQVARPVVPAPPRLGPAPRVAAASLVVIDPRTGHLLAASNATTRRAVASTQKVLTGIIIAEAGNLDQKVRIQSSDCWPEPTKIGFKTGDVYTRRQLLNAMMVKSGNDAAAALGRDHSGSTAAFAQRMTYRAQQLGARSSVFRNPHGLTESGQLSTAGDMARICMRAYRMPELRNIVRQQSYHFRFSSGRSTTLTSTNKLLKRMSVVNGMKTGYTRAAGRCLVTTASHRGRDLLVVQLGSKERYIWDDAERLVRWGLQM